ncbi:hypothetical protein MTR_2g055460 [Medicago truncatula]|uniref:Uncharacterized protein n=1 Tax=Medicago truncatula TaxID=3880 RepID=A0A072V8N7_MEDTR|nr:hypothetical protein MTR_2g055460 [Medicago truncatula]
MARKHSARRKCPVPASPVSRSCVFFTYFCFELDFGVNMKSPTGRANLLTAVFGKLRASSDYYKRDRTGNLRTCCAKVLIENGLKKATKCTQIT